MFADPDTLVYLPKFYEHLLNSRRRASELLRTSLKRLTLNSNQKTILLKAGATCGALALRSERGRG